MRLLGICNILFGPGVVCGCKKKANMVLEKGNTSYGLLHKTVDSNLGKKALMGTQERGMSCWGKEESA